MRRLALALVALSMAACSPPAPQSQAEDPAATPSSPGAEAPDPERDAMAAALASAAQPELGVPVSFAVTTKRVEGDWGWLVAQPWTPDGAAIDWSTTRYAAQAQQGALDAGGATYALLRRDAGNWRVVAFAIGPTDAAYADWPARYGAPASLIQTPPS